jgi:hypothetical protein
VTVGRPPRHERGHLWAQSSPFKSGLTGADPVKPAVKDVRMAMARQ